MGVSNRKFEVLTFKKRENGKFEFTRNFVDGFGDREIERTEVDGYFLEKDVMDVTVESKKIWMNSQGLSEGKPEHMEISETNWNGQAGYSVKFGEHEKACYSKENGILLGAEIAYGESRVDVRLIDKK